MLSKNAFTYSTVRYIILCLVYCIALGHNTVMRVSRLPEMSKFQGVHIYMYLYMCVRVCAYVCVCVRAYVCVRVCVCVCVVFAC